MTELEYLRNMIQLRRNFLDKRLEKEKSAEVAEVVRARIDAYNVILNLIGEVQETVHDIPKPATDPDLINQI